MDENIEQRDSVDEQSAASTPPQVAVTGRPQRKKGRGVVGLLLAGMMMLGMLLGGAGAGVAVTLVNATAAPTSTTLTAATNGSAQTVADVETNTIASVYADASASVVRITSVIRSTGRFQASGEAVGTGIVLDSSGNILTNNHVIDGATSLSVEFSDGSTYPATVVGASAANDLAVIKVTAPASALVPATLGDSSTVQSGDTVIAIGYPYGLDQSVTAGIVSGLDRSSADDSGSQYGSTQTSSEDLSGLIQIDAAINPGNSGGPLLNTSGEVVGINTMIESPVDGFTGIGLAIPINQAKALITQLESGSGNVG